MEDKKANPMEMTQSGEWGQTGEWGQIFILDI
jgi:hypothetical protein